MKKRILSYGLSATHEAITALSSIQNPESISDFDAFVIDPEQFKNEGVSAEAFQRRKAEINDLLTKKAGIVISILRPNIFINVNGAVTPAYELLQGSAAYPMVNLVIGHVRAGTGSTLALKKSAKGPTAAYLQVVREKLRFVADLEISDFQAQNTSASIFAVNSVDKAVAIEFKVSEGVLSFVPTAHNILGDRLGAAIALTVKKHFETQIDIDAPIWADEIVVPGAHAHDERIAALSEQRNQLDIEVASLEDKRVHLLNHRRLLFGYGKSILETEARIMFRLLGFLVPEPDEYVGEWDVELRESDSTRTAIGEVEGSEGLIDVDKYRQLLDYVEAEALEGRNHKGILIGNGFRLLSPDAVERINQFSEHALRGATRNHFCLLPTTELFKAGCAVLETPNDEGLKAAIRESIFSTVGVWRFQE